MAVMLPMDTVGPRGAEEVHRNLGALGEGPGFKDDSACRDQGAWKRVHATLSGLRGFRDPSSFSGAEGPRWLSRMPSLMLSRLVSVQETFLNTHCQSRVSSAPAASQPLPVPLWAALLGPSSPPQPLQARPARPTAVRPPSLLPGPRVSGLWGPPGPVHASPRKSPAEITIA